MTVDERTVVPRLLRFGCPADLPRNVHIDTDLLRRHTEKSVARLKRLGGISSLGFECSIRESTDEEARVHGTVLGDSYLFELDWVDLSDEGEYPALLVAHEMVAVQQKIIVRSMDKSSWIDLTSRNWAKQQLQRSRTSMKPVNTYEALSRQAQKTPWAKKSNLHR